MSYFIIGFLSIIVVGLMEVTKKYLPKNCNDKIVTAISVAIAIGLTVVYGIAFQFGVLKTIVTTFGVVGLTQTSYNFVFKLLKAAIEKLKSKKNDN